MPNPDCRRLTVRQFNQVIAREAGIIKEFFGHLR